jgi:hypothetical protein
VIPREIGVAPVRFGCHIEKGDAFRAAFFDSGIEVCVA